MKNSCENLFTLWLVSGILKQVHSANDGPLSESPPTTGFPDSANASDVSKPGLTSAAGGLLSGVDRGMLLRMTYVLLALTALIGLYFGIKMWRIRKKDRVRRYDILSAKQLQPELIVDSEDSDDEIFNDDSQATRLVKQDGSANK